MKKLLTLLLVGAMCVSATACSKESSENNTEKNLSSVETEKSMEITTDDVATASSLENLSDLEKMEFLLSSLIDVSLYNVDDSISGQKNYNLIDEIYTDMDSSICLDDGTTVILLESTINDLIESGYSPENLNSDEDVIYRKDVVLSKDGLKFNAQISSEETDLYNAVVRSAVLNNNSESIGFAFGGISNEANIENVINTLGTPTASISICDKSMSLKEKCYIILGYITEEDLYAGFTFEYDPITHTTSFDNVYVDFR